MRTAFKIPEAPVGKPLYQVSPFLEPVCDSPLRVYVPHAGREFELDERMAKILASFRIPRTLGNFSEQNGFQKVRTEPRLQYLLKNQILLETSIPWDRRFHLKYVQIEPNTRCNHRCVYCPVSIAPRPEAVMGMDLFTHILEQIRPFYSSLEGIALSSYNEPTLDPHFLDRVRELKHRGLSLILATNGSGLHPPVLDELLGLGMDHIEVNLPTLDSKEYLRLHGTRDIPRILRNLNYAVSRGAPVIIQVQGPGDEAHRRRYERILEKFSGTSASVVFILSTDRAGRLGRPWDWHLHHPRLRGCSNMGSRPINWLHVNARGLCFFCCQDFEERHVIGDIRKQSVQEILAGEASSALRRWAYGLEEAPEDFICRRCTQALTAECRI